MLVLDRATVHDVLPVRTAVGAMRKVFVDFAEGRAEQPPKLLVRPSGFDGLAVVKPAAVSGKRGALGMKIVTEFPGNADRGLDLIQGAVVLLDPETGIVEAVLDAGAVTAIRTAAVSALATELLARPDAGDVAVLGAGVQARGHLLSMAAVRTLRRVRVWNRTTGRAEELVAWARTVLDVPVDVAPSVEEATRGADIICTVTSSPTPILESGQVEDGAHVNAVGAYLPTTRELAGELIARASVFVEIREFALVDAGDIVLPLEDGQVDKDDAITADLGELVTGAHPGRRDGDEVTVFKSLGMGLEDVAAAVCAVGQARTRGLGTSVPFP